MTSLPPSLPRGKREGEVRGGQGGGGREGKEGKGKCGVGGQGVHKTHANRTCMVRMPWSPFSKTEHDSNPADDAAR